MLGSLGPSLWAHAGEGILPADSQLQRLCRHRVSMFKDGLSGVSQSPTEEGSAGKSILRASASPGENGTHHLVPSCLATQMQKRGLYEAGMMTMTCPGALGQEQRVHQDS